MITRKEEIEKQGDICIEFLQWITNNYLSHDKPTVIVGKVAPSYVFHIDDKDSMKRLYATFRLEKEKDSNYCDECDEPAYFDESPEGQNCAKCGAWLCDNCTTWRDETPLCRDCNKESEKIL